jgi:tRNA threonylcarbamoyladenosine biosynthesis protein TsaB
MHSAFSISNKSAKTESKMSFFLALQATYTSIEIGLYQDERERAYASIDKHHSNTLLINTIDKCLKEHNLELSNLQFIAVNLGPAPFTSLRTVLASANGIAFASDCPLVGVDGLHVFAKENQSSEINTAYLLNAFNQDVYYCLQESNSPLKTGCLQIDAFCQLPDVQKNGPWRFLGNGAVIFREKIQTALGKQARIEEIPDFSTLEGIASEAFENWKQKKSVLKHALPLYLKETHYKKSPIVTL